MNKCAATSAPVPPPTVILYGMTVAEGRLPLALRERLGFDTGLLVTCVSPESQAWDAGVRQGSVVPEVNGETTRTVGQLRSVLGRHDPHEPLCLFLLEGEEWRFVLLPKSRHLAGGGYLKKEVGHA